MDHPNKHINQAVKYAMAQGWTLKKGGGGHAWGILRCPDGTREGHSVVVYGTPRVPERHARQIRKVVDGCDHARP